MGFIDYEFKAKVLNEQQQLIKEYKRSSLYDYAINNYNNNGVVMNCLKYYSNDTKSMLDLYLYCCDNGLQKEYKEIKKIVHADYTREQRLRKRVHELLIKGQCLFVTLTFNDNTLNNTDAKQRRLYVTRFLKSCNGSYVGNIDFGSKNHREHYHALIQCNDISFNAWHKFGAIKVERVRNRNIDTDKVRLSKYITKLSNHCIKDTTKRSALIYSRN